MISRAIAALVAAACVVFGAWLALHHPLSGPLAAALFGLACVGLGCWPRAWLVLLPALLPVLALAPWSGWITVEEIDLLVLAAAAGGYGRWAWRPLPRPGGIDLGALLALLLLALWTASVLVSLQRGVADAGGLVLDWYQAYRGPMNALRLAKATLAVWLLLPLWLRLDATPGPPAVERLTLGLALCYGLTALSCLHERLAYTAINDFNSDYRTTGLFWEMHVGGAGLDACLAMSFPFAWRWWAQARTRWQTGLGLALLVLGVYAALTTFSRILLLALPIGWLTLLLVQRLAGGAFAPAASQGQATRPQWLAFGALFAAVTAGGAWLFPAGGYRGLLAVLASAALLLNLAPALARSGWRVWASGLGLALLIAPVGLTAAMLLAKGAYLAFAAVWLATAGLMLSRWRGTAPALALALAGFWTAVAAAGLVAWQWGGPDGLQRAWPALLALSLGLPLLARLRPLPWPDDRRWQGGGLAALLAAAMVIAIFSGGAYMSTRLAAVQADEDGRVAHWRRSLNLVHGDLAAGWGIGLGRYLDSYALAATDRHRPGDLRIADVDGMPVMRMYTGSHVQGWGELLRLSQRTARPQGGVTVKLKLRGAPGSAVHAEICIKHLLYDMQCQTADARLPLLPKPAVAAPLVAAAAAPAWQTVQLVLRGQPLVADAWTLPRVTTFSLASENARAGLDIAELSATDAQGRELLVNGNFQAGGARWFFSSDRNHLPWHAKNMLVHLFVEQGLFGVLTMGLMALCALAVCLARARRLPLAPALAAALAGGWTVGMIDSVLDMPRLALLLLLITTVAIAQRPPQRLSA